MKLMIQTLIEGIPKAELHVHLEGTLEPKMMLEMAARNGIDVPYDGMNIYSAYNFQNLSSFLKLYYGGLEVLCTEEDFFDLTKAYMDRIHLDNVRHTEIFFNPQNHVKRGISFETVFNGIERALCESDISSYLILDFNRTFSIESAFEILEEAVNYQHRIIGVGLDSIEDGYPPELFTDVFKRAEELGFHKVCHTGEETPKHITDTLDFLNVERIDHGVQCEHDEKLMQRLVDEQIPLTICPLSNVKLKVFDKMENHNLKRLMDRGIPITINSDDPAYFGGYINENYYKVQQAFNMEAWMIVDLAKNSFKFSFLPEKEKKNHIKNIDKFIKGL